MSDLHLIGTEWDDVLSGGDGNDWLEGLGGDDTLDGGFGNNLLDGGAGSDTVDYTTHGYAGVFVDLGAGYADFLDVEWVDGSLIPIPYRDTLVSIENAEGSDSGDTLIGSAAANRLSGWGGDDHLEGGAGDDVLDGGSGVDQLDGGDGDDAFIVASGWDHEWYPWAIETITGGAGNDVIRFTSTTSGDVLHLTSTTSGVETIVISDAAGDTSGTTALSINARYLSYGVTLIGNDGANFLNGTLWDDSLLGGGGDDNIIAGGGNNLYDGGAGSDTLHYSGLIAPLFVDLEAGYGFFADSFWQDGEEFVFESTDTLVGVENIESGDGDGGIL